MWTRRALLSLTLAAAASRAVRAAEGPRRVLLLYSFGPRFAPFDAFASPFRQELALRTHEPLVFSELSLDALRPLSPDDERAFLDYTRALFAGRPPALVTAIGGAAARFAETHRAEFFPETPLVISATEGRRVERTELGEHDVLSAHRIDVPAIVETILAVRPETARLVVVLGASPLERLWRKLVEVDLAPFAGRLSIEWTNDLSFGEIGTLLAGLPSDAAVIHGLLIVDAAGVPFEENEALPRLAAASAAPVFGIFGSQLGKGIVGGRLVSVSEMADVAAAAGAALLEGTPARDVHPKLVEAGPPTFDSRQLVRFGIPETALPEGSRVLYREAGAWDRYRGPILGAAAFFGLQTAYIVGLLASRGRLRRSEAALTESEAQLGAAVAEARDFAGRLIRAQEDERSRLGRELHDDITQRLAVLAIDVGRCERLSGAALAAPLAGVRDGLARLSGDVHALSYQLHPSILADLGLVVALENETERVTRIDGLPVTVDVEGVPDAVPRPVALCLFRVAQEALRNAVRHAGATGVRVTLRATEDRITLRVEDDGVGFDPETARLRPSLGIASMRQRVAAVGGALAVHTGPKAGTLVEVAVPLEEGRDDTSAASAGR